MAMRGPQRSWRNPATYVAILVLACGLAMVFLDALDRVLFGVDVEFAQWPWFLVGAPIVYFLGITLPGFIDTMKSENGGKQ